MTDTDFDIFVHDGLTWVAIETTDANPEAYLASTTSVRVRQ